MYFSIMVSSGYMPKSGIVGYDNFMPSCFVVVVLRNLHTVFHSGYINLHSHKKGKRVPFSPCLLQHLIFIHFLVLAILTSMR